jgi:spoIIIJ-associated protein
MTDRVITKGKTVNEAVAEALLQLGARKNEVNITVISEPKEGLFGFLGKRSAKVEVTKKQRSPKARNNRHKPKKTENKAERPTKQSPPATKPSKPNTRNKPKPAQDSKKSVTVKLVGDSVKASTIASVIEKTDVSESANLQQNIAEKLMGICGFPCRCEVVVEEYNIIKVITDVDSAGILIGRKGYTIDALEHLVDRMGARAMQEHVRMNLDVNNYRVRRNSELVDDVKEAVAQVIDSGKAVHLEPVCARERRLMHMEVADVEELDTYTSGYGPKRHVVICMADSGSKNEKPEE